MTLLKSRPPTESKHQVEKSGLLDRAQKGTYSKPCPSASSTVTELGWLGLRCLHADHRTFLIFKSCQYIFKSCQHFRQVLSIRQVRAEMLYTNCAPAQLRKRKLLARQVVHQDKVYAKTLRAIPRHLSQVAGTQ